MQYNNIHVEKILNCTPIFLSDNKIEHISYDSRSISIPDDTIFFALKNRLDGHDFIQEAYGKGVRSFVVQTGFDEEKFPNASFFQVKKPLEALQKLAKFHRLQFTLPVIGITGSNGKTIVKDWLSQLLDDSFFIVKNPRSYNSQLGVALSVLGIEKTHTLGIFEAGISQKKEMKNLAEIIQPSIGILTNIGDAHNEGFLNEEEKIQEKTQLFKGCETIICNEKFIPFFEKNNFKGKIGAWKISEIEAVNNFETKVTFFFQGKKEIFNVPFSDYPSVENVVTCCCTMLCMNFDKKTIAIRIAKLQAVALRMEIKAAVNNCLIINDSYSADLTSLAYSLDFLAQQAKGKKTLILSDIFQSGLNDEQLAKKINELLVSKGVHRLVWIGEKNYDAFLPNIPKQFFTSTNDFLQKIKYSDFQQETILLKGARVFEFERIAEFLAQKAHRTVLEINLDALRHNLSVYSRLLQPNVKTLVMVKASAYGSGSAEVAKLLEYQRVDYLGVAYTDEGVALRKEGIRLPILVLNPEESSFPALLRYDLEPEIYCFSQLERFLAFFKNEEKKCNIHLKLDTGMHRLGFEMEDMERLLELLKEEKNIVVKSIFSHLSGSEAVEHDAFTHRQAQLFLAMNEKISTGLGYQPIRHICNTGGIARFPQYHFDMVRLGIGIYGIDSSQALQKDLQIVTTLKATISQIKKIPKGETVGYSRKGLADRNLHIATISIGYADGLLRAAGNGRFSVRVNGQLAPIIGNVCMDMTMIDITDLENVKEGDEVVIFGHSPSVEDLAKSTQTIAYEVFTNISDRVKRVYFRE
jgi:alanine racemase